jgi:hypothetical protein
MSYTKQNWQTGEIITADKLNHIENGIEEASYYIVRIDNNNGKASLSQNQIRHIFDSNILILLNYENSYYFPSLINNEEIVFIKVSIQKYVEGETSEGISSQEVHIDNDCNTTFESYFITTRS